VTLVLDASALLALIFEETGADVVAASARRGIISAVNYSEVIVRIMVINGDVRKADEAVSRLEIDVVPFDAAMAHQAAALRASTKHLGLSLGDRTCLALGMSIQSPVLTADKDWAKLNIGIEIRLIR
jgi:PIN domain nuclease of toxin-antitoxin system